MGYSIRNFTIRHSNWSKLRFHLLYVVKQVFFNHVNNEIHFIELGKYFFVIQEANKFEIGSNQLKKDSLLLLFRKPFVFRGKKMINLPDKV